ncbi:MAG TPA: malto-oligosyltrehalose trehalohydrolase [Stellaceae bacterium]|nr:malto-oligosyltrehalose trehalohydrolase [Stellaceae bacterium]
MTNADHRFAQHNQGQPQQDQRRPGHYRFGPVVTPGGVCFRLWAPSVDAVSLVLDGQAPRPMTRRPKGWFEVTAADARPGSRYRFRIGDLDVPDPASRYQPEGIQGPSEVVDHDAYRWQDAAWRGKPWHESVVYELHAGTFDAQGGFDGIAAHLDHLADLGVDTVQIMPVAETPGRWNWGYDGVLLYAVEERYGGPEALKRLVDACHARGMQVFLDVVYNHFGPEGNYLHVYAERFFTEKHHTPWGAAINFDDKGAGNVRRFFIENALYWLEQFHIDGLRFDAVHAFKDDTRPDIVIELGERIRAALPDRQVHLILENEQNRATVLGYGYGGPGPYDAQWNDDFHHAIRVSISDADHGYYRDYRDKPAERLGRMLAEGFAYQGETSANLGRSRGQSSGLLPPTSFVAFIQNHDQVGNHAFGWRLPKFAEASAIRAASAIMILSPQIPMLFMGEEWGTEQPFPFFCDFSGDLAEAIREGRAQEFAHFPEFQDAAARARIPDPLAEATFKSAVLDWTMPESGPGKAWLDHYRNLIALRRQYIVPLIAKPAPDSGTFRLLGGHAAAVRWPLAGGAKLQMVVNLSDQPAEAPPVMLGNTIYASQDRAETELPPWYVAVAIADGGSAA